MKTDEGIMTLKQVPTHYDFPVQPIEYFKPIIKEMDGFEGACTLKVGKYISRWYRKDKLRDLHKCRDFLNELIAYEESKLNINIQKESDVT